ncbi:alpha/beta-hydrolase [Stipitochalara longipes BDJ]|nr:alpha/beta-hydrolase [Stipitochalara longipes BDJ]
MTQEIEGAFDVPDHHALYTKTWTVNNPPRAKLIFVHNFNDHINRYWELFPTLASRGIAVYGFDQRGWGKSERGLGGPMKITLSDLATFVRIQLPSPVPVFLMGHSYSSTAILTLASSPQYEDLITQIKALLLASPYFAFTPKAQPSQLLVSIMRPVAKLFPNKQITVKGDHSLTTHDPEVAKSSFEDKLLHATGTLESIMDYIAAAEALRHGKAKLSKSVQSVLFAYGTGDISLDHKVSKEW